MQYELILKNIMKTKPKSTIQRMYDLIVVLHNQAKDNPKIVKSIFGYAVVNEVNEIIEQHNNRNNDK